MASRDNPADFTDLLTTITYNPIKKLSLQAY